MAEVATSGLGRNGSWLQNRWLRVESRLDDGSISPIALAGAFRPGERVHSLAALAGDQRLAFARSDYDIAPHADALGRGCRLALASRQAGFTLRREVVLYDDRPQAFVRIGVTNDGRASLRIASLHPFSIPGEGRGRLRLAAKPRDMRIYRHGWQSWSPTLSLGGQDRDVRSRVPVLSPEPTSDRPGSFNPEDVAVLFDAASGRSLLVGAVTARNQLTRVSVDAPARSLDVCCLADGVPLQPGETIWSERIAIDLVGHPNEQLARYGDALGQEMGARVPAHTPAGWCSWYYFYTDVREDDIVRNLRFLERHRRELPIDTVQIDDGYQADIGDWLTVNDKFPRGMAWLASEIKRAGFVPGLWLAPLLMAESSQTYAAHPEWAVRDDAGAPVVAQNNWQRRNFAVDGSHPGARAWLTQLLREICDGWGYDYVKIDFLHAGAIAGRRYDDRATRISAYRAALAAVRKGVGPDRFILGCGAPMAPSVGCFDGNRIGPDVAPWWRNLNAGERAKPRPRWRTPDDDLSAEVAIRNTLTRSWMHGRLWANDPDCLLVRTDRTKLTLDETRTLASAIGLSAGMMLSSDDLPRLPAERVELISMLLPTLTHSAVPVDLMQRDMPERFDLAIERGFDPLRVVALFNFDDEARDLVLPLPDRDCHAFELWDERYLGVVRGELVFALVAPHACRVVALRRSTPAPQLAGATAHIGVGALDVTSQSYDPGSRRLALGLAPAGRRRRRICIATAGLVATAARLGGAPVALETARDALWLTVDVDKAAILEVDFA